MTEEEFFALSKSEQAKALIQNGGMGKFLESAMQQSRQWQTDQVSSASSSQVAAAAGSAPTPGKALNLNAGSQYGVSAIWGQGPFMMQTAHSRLFMIRNKSNQRR
jgi:hypothetical protein